MEAARPEPECRDMAAILRAAERLLGQAFGSDAGPVKVILKNARGRLCLGRDGTPNVGGQVFALSALERSIVAAVGEGEMTARQIAGPIHHAYDVQLRTILANLCERQPPVLQSGPSGYRMAPEM
jgi:hypothetical protein